jgi:hypothetical protein
MPDEAARVLATHGTILHYFGGLARCEWEESVTTKKWVACMCVVSKGVRFRLHTSYVLFSGNVVVRILVLSRVDRRRCLLELVV